MTIELNETEQVKLFLILQGSKKEHEKALETFKIINETGADMSGLIIYQEKEIQLIDSIIKLLQL